ncbi:MAG: nuclear transport factor 2 family protein [Acidobacteriota bacterium]
MGAAENKRLFQRVFAELAVGDSRPFAAILSDDIRWTVIGTTHHSGTYEGKQNVLHELMARVMSHIVDHIAVTPHRFIADDEYVVVEFSGKSTTRDGKPYDNTYCWVHRVVDGMVVEVTEYLDTELVTSVFGK